MPLLGNAYPDKQKLREGMIGRDRVKRCCIIYDICSGVSVKLSSRALEGKDRVKRCCIKITN